MPEFLPRTCTGAPCRATLIGWLTMGVSANVQSIEALKQLRIALCKFAEACRGSASEADADLQRYIFWLNEDRRRFWKEEIRKREEKLRQAKMALLQKKLQKTATGGRPSCVDEEKVLALAMRRFEEAQLKSSNTTRWIRKLDEQIFEFKGLLQAFNHALDYDVVNGLAWLDRMIESLDAYVSLAPPIDLSAPEEVQTEFASVSRPDATVPEEEAPEATEEAGAPPSPDEVEAGKNESLPHAPEEPETLS